MSCIALFGSDQLMSRILLESLLLHIDCRLPNAPLSLMPHRTPQSDCDSCAKLNCVHVAHDSRDLPHLMQTSHRIPNHCLDLFPSINAIVYGHG
jgi:hypothetical protein